MVLTPARTLGPERLFLQPAQKVPLLGRTMLTPREKNEIPVETCPWTTSSVADGSFRQRVARLAHKHRRMHLWLPGLDQKDSGQGVCLSEIRALGVLYDAVAEAEPRTYVVPLLRCAGWTEGAIPDGEATSLHESAADPSAPGYERVLYPELIPANPTTAEQGGSSQRLDHPQPADPLPPCFQLSFDHVAVGGTFDRLHCGHELLLASTALLASKTVYVGITADKLLANKNHRELLQPYQERHDAAVQFMRAVRPGLHVQAGALTDPNEPTQAELDPAMQALVVSQETLPGATRINEGRIARGFKPLIILVVPVIGFREKQKLSSSQLRAQDAALPQAV